MSSSSRTVVINNVPHFTLCEDGTVIRHVANEVLPPNPNDFTDGAKSKDVTVDADTGVFVRMYLPECEQNEIIPVLFYVHGGAFCIASADCKEYHNYMNKLASHVRAFCISVNYRLCPEHRLPAAYDDCFDALRWLLTGPGRNDPWVANHGDLSSIFLAGDSAGGNVVHELGLRARRAEWGSKFSAIFVHPFFRVSNYSPRDDDDNSPRDDDDNVTEFLLPLGEDMDYPPFNPISPRSPPLTDLVYEKFLVCVAENDSLRPAAESYFKELVRVGFKADLMTSLGESHAFHVLKSESPSTVELLDRIRNFLHGV